MKTLGQNIARYRKEKNITQETLAERCGVSPQAVSKWENDISCSDIMLLKILARIFGISVDELLDDGSEPITRLAEKEKAKLLKLRAVDNEDKVSINLPIALIELLLQNGAMKERLFSGDKAKMFGAVDFEQILELVSLGVMGKILEAQSSDGGFVEVWVE